jgi:hypothetical protein
VLSGQGVHIPKKVIVIGYKDGTYKDNNDDEQPWASLIVNDAEEVVKLKQVGLESIANELTLKLSNYDGSNLDKLVGQTFGTENFDVVFQSKNSRFGSSINGVAFKIDFSEVR